MSIFGTELEAIHFPLLGNSVAVGLFSLLHIVLAALSVAFMLMAPVFEFRGRTNPFDRDLAFGLTRFTIVVFSVSTVLAVIMVELMIGLFPVTTMWMWNHFRVPIVFGILAFILQLFALYPYYHFWEPLRDYSMRFHMALGTFAAIFMLMWVVMLDGMGSYMLTPVEGSGPWERLSNPTWLPLSLHRMGGNFMIAGYCIAAYGAWRAGRPPDHSSHPYYGHLFKTGVAIGLGGLLIQPFTGVLYRVSIHRAAPGTDAVITQGAYRPMMYVQFFMLGLLFLGNYLLLRSTRPARAHTRRFDVGFPFMVMLMLLSVDHAELRRVWLYGLVGLTIWYLITHWRTSFAPIDPSTTFIRPLALGMGLLSVFLYLTMGTIRETSRRPDTISGKISLEDEVRPQAQFKGAAR